MTDEDALQRERDAMQEIFDAWRDDFVKGLPKRLQACTFNSFEAVTPELESAARHVSDWTSSVRKGGTGLFLTGGVGLGKTHLAVAAAVLLVARGWRARYVPVAEYLDRLRGSFDPGGKKCPSPRSLANGDLLVLDDLGVERPTEWVREQVYAMVDDPYNNDVTVIVTSNQSYSELSHPSALGERTASRLVQMTDKVEFAGEDWRARQHRERRGER